MRSGGMFDEALGIAKVLCKLLPADDPERGLACRVVGEVRGGLDKWLQRWA